MRKLLYITFVLLVGFSCEKEGVEPVGFFQADYYTDPEADQVFQYFYDDGEFVAGGLDQYMVQISSSAGTFSSEAQLMLKYSPSIGSLPDSLIPFTYFMGMSYTGEIKKEVEFRINYDYPYNNLAHQDYLETQFFFENLSDLKIIELGYQPGSEVYYDPDYTISEVPHTIDTDTKDVVFSTSSPSSLFALCWIEETWRDTIDFTIPGTYDNMEQSIYGGTRTSAVNAPGATYTSDGILHFHYANSSLLSETNSNVSGWTIHQLDLVIQNPQQGIIDHENIDLDLLIGRVSSGTETYTHLQLNSNTDVEIVDWPNYREHGQITVSGPMKLSTDLSTPNIDFSLKFKRQR